MDRLVGSSRLDGRAAGLGHSCDRDLGSGFQHGRPLCEIRSEGSRERHCLHEPLRLRSFCGRGGAAGCRDSPERGGEHRGWLLCRGLHLVKPSGGSAHHRARRKRLADSFHPGRGGKLQLYRHLSGPQRHGSACGRQAHLHGFVGPRLHPSPDGKELPAFRFQ